MISKEDGETILNFSTSNDLDTETPILIYADFKIPTLLNNTVQWDLWTTVLDSRVFTFLNEFSHIFEHLSPFLALTPYFDTFVCGYCKHENFTQVNENCYSGGRYCYKDPGTHFFLNLG